MVDLGQKGVRNCGRLFKIHTHKKTRLHTQPGFEFYNLAIISLRYIFW